jgi:DNA (cytosine-5)-methyltransferase 1
MNELALFAGAGGGILGGKLLGWTTVCAVEIEEYPRKVLLQRQRDGILGKFPIWNDITTFDGRPWKGLVDIVSGGFPCQDISAAGKGAGIEGERSGLWSHMARVVREVSPRFVFVENSPMLTSRGLYRVLGDLAEMGYDARWCVLGADDAGAPHRRKRIWILGYASLHGQSPPEIREGSFEGSDYSETGEIEASKLERSGSSRINEKMADTGRQHAIQGNSTGMDAEKEKRTYSPIYDKPSGSGCIEWWDTDPAELPNTTSFGLEKQRLQQGLYIGENGVCDRENSQARKEWATEPQLGRVAHGVANRVDRLKAIGNGQVPAVAALAFTILSEGLI